MTRFSEILDLAETATQSLNLLEQVSKERVQTLFGRFENNLMTYGELRIELLRHARASFASGGAIAVQHVKDLTIYAGLPELETSVVQSATVLDLLLEDMKTNLEGYRDSERNEVALRRLRFRTSLSVQQAVRRGFTTNQIAASDVLAAQGASLRKMWLANFVDNTPCESCASLHGVDIPLHEEFNHGGAHSPKVYDVLQGPPRHPNCHCYMLVYVVSLDMLAVAPERPSIFEDEKYMSSKDVRKLPRAIFAAVIATLRLIAGTLKGAVRGRG